MNRNCVGLCNMKKKGFLQKLILSPHYMGKAGNRHRVPTCDEMS